ncbi:CBS domain-containing protein [Savagea sp. SN6]|uniref:CBS domain-containing protein n=1 Tax=Savagea serpentis TaxID=2785297 RepID=A0A8J7KF06_9BACL|nr:DRTGG domain-containing protein [Savagea serpentis]MBF4501716.1 CBS domain-containing protein [Savagea serpentis]
MATKHEQILRYIEGLEVGEKISVRQVARALSVSEGTAYRAIKEAENQKLVNTIERVGTIRIEKKKKENIEKLTFAEVVNIVDGQVLGGRNGLHKTLTKFVIGAMQLPDMEKYIDAGSLLIVGNRERAHESALNAGAAILITGGFDTAESAKRIADELDMPIISTSYDTFTVATMLNRAIYDQLIEKEILLVEDIITPLEKTIYFEPSDTIEYFNQVNRKSAHSGYPVIDENKKLVGIVTSRDAVGKEEHLLIRDVMSTHPVTVNDKMTVAAAGHNMIWEGVDLTPVVDRDDYLEGIISRRDVLKAFQMAQRQPQQGETIDDIVRNQMADVPEDPTSLAFTVTPQLTNHFGALSYGALTTILTEFGSQLLKQNKRSEGVPESLTVYFVKQVPLGGRVLVKSRILHLSRRSVKFSFDFVHNQEVIASAMVMYQLFEK